MHEAAVKSALGVMEAHLAALNARDPEAIAETLHFPHYRLAGESVNIWESPECYLDDFRARAGNDWGHTEWGRLEPIQTSEAKVHLNVEVKRFDRQGAPLVTFASLWVVTRIGGVWAAQMRSSFAEDLA